ncbi:hypothetical protein GCM10010289_34990 [Streptomyces violascens]|uniref:Uncharacterized protein n=1 Tax=Streptomyces violascens TaxID=67381 RepID=A0ABQ3R1E2_9ACTN|nr:hypothetical protein GCM10010289_34990 [Streptomyces violascens]GHI43322.1 hypothetical protein Sviol_77300 [Streptomyces violascens]
MHPVEPPLVGEELHVPPHGHRRDPQLRGELGHPRRAAPAHQPQQSVMTFSSTFTHSGIPFAVWRPGWAQTLMQRDRTMGVSIIRSDPLTFDQTEF